MRLRPAAGPDVTMLRMVESGSGYLAQNGYDLLVAAPWPGVYDVEVRFADGWVRTTARPGDALTIRADGTVAHRPAVSAAARAGRRYLKRLFGTFTCTPIVGRSTSCVTATCPATLTS